MGGGGYRRNIQAPPTESCTNSQKSLAAKYIEKVSLIDTSVSMEEFLNSTVGPDGDKLSGGQKQRLVLARALFHGADVLALDEIISGLELDSKRKVLNLLKDLAAASKLIILISHDPIAEEYASKLISL